MGLAEAIAYVNGQVACALAEVEGMKAENAQRTLRGESMAYVYDDFVAIIDKYCISHNGVLGLFQNAWRG